MHAQHDVQPQGCSQLGLLLEGKAVALSDLPLLPARVCCWSRRDQERATSSGRGKLEKQQPRRKQQQSRRAAARPPPLLAAMEAAVMAAALLRM